ncbi:hypothetical protein FGKAn22_15540 [Ferrigenium kumadai]|uniref:Uncharacterized protein n=1 Tax=Ferrigenium kumadai TaxID=1682490 RepID=A0AAN1W0Q2_9PROT|nr:hypothetical protein [Ferrigenium kumadai]BBI99861.1 hypothetical protein FGKAn22_15540 [Ferrigenium kumadai]
MAFLAGELPSRPALRQLAPFIFLSLLLHGALLLVVRPPTNNPIAKPHPLEVYFTLPAVIVPARSADTVPATEPRYHAARTHVARFAGQAGSASPSAAKNTVDQPDFNPQQLIESAKSMARDEARKTEQQLAAQEKKNLNTPLGSLEQYLRQSHKEQRLANGMLKITTEAGSVCFQPVPYFARDQAGLYGIPMTCP